MTKSSSENRERKIIHVDMDAFFASVEQRDNASLRGKPVVVGGTPDRRGVVAAASYEARSFGIHSAMPSRTALERCPALIFVKPRFEVYRSVSSDIHRIFHDYTDLVEPLSLDEAYLDVTVNKVSNPSLSASATLIAREIKARIFAETELTASAGVSINKFLAKTASAVRKPNGLFLIKPDQAESFAEALPIEKFYGIGHVTAGKMKASGIHTGKDLKALSEAELISRFGKAGSYYYHIARGRDDRPVVPNRVRKSVGAEESYADDLNGMQAIHEALGDIAETLERRLERAGTGGRTLTLKVKYGDYQQVTRSRTTFVSISRRAEMLKVAMELLSSTEVLSKSVRLLGLTVSNLDTEEEATTQEEQYVQLKLDFDW
ncbi:MAG: DNA polymerase IV [Candidatus Obscuribacter sp.]|nr:DNA polymerase IV [Candidatus Obscuribacter sp.]